MNQELFERFIEAVKAGKVEWLSHYDRPNENVLLLLEGHPVANRCHGAWHLHDQKQGVRDHLCAHLRRWLTEEGWYWSLQAGGIALHRVMPPQDDLKAFFTGTELDWHIAAALWVLDQVAGEKES